MAYPDDDRLKNFVAVEDLSRRRGYSDNPDQIDFQSPSTTNQHTKESYLDVCLANLKRLNLNPERIEINGQTVLRLTGDDARNFAERSARLFEQAQYLIEASPKERNVDGSITIKTPLIMKGDYTQHQQALIIALRVVGIETPVGAATFDHTDPITSMKNNNAQKGGVESFGYMPTYNHAVITLPQDSLNRGLDNLKLSLSLGSNKDRAPYVGSALHNIASAPPSLAAQIDRANRIREALKVPEFDVLRGNSGGLYIKIDGMTEGQFDTLKSRLDRSNIPCQTGFSPLNEHVLLIDSKHETNLHQIWRETLYAHNEKRNSAAAAAPSPSSGHSGTTSVTSAIGAQQVSAVGKPLSSGLTMSAGNNTTHLVDQMTVGHAEVGEIQGATALQPKLQENLRPDPKATQGATQVAPATTTASNEALPKLTPAPAQQPLGGRDTTAPAANTTEPAQQSSPANNGKSHLAKADKGMGHAQVGVAVAAQLAQGNVGGAATVIAENEAFKLASKVAAEALVKQGLKSAGLVVGVGATLGFGASAVIDKWNGKRYGASAIEGVTLVAEAAGNFVPTGLGGTAIREIFRKAVVSTVGEKYAPEKSGLRQSVELGAQVGSQALKTDGYKSMDLSELKGAILADATLPKSVKIGSVTTPLTDALKDEKFRTTMITNLESAQEKGHDLGKEIEMIKAYGDRLSAEKQATTLKAMPMFMQQMI